jgi:hypothetical protein
MKVYIAKKEIIFTGPVYKVIKEGTKFYEDGDCYISNAFYPIRKEHIEDRPDEYEKQPDDDKTPDYYLTKVYSQYEMDVTILSLSNALKNK